MASRALENLLQPLHLELVGVLRPERLSLMTCPKLQATMADVLQKPTPLRLIVYAVSNTLCYLHYGLKFFFSFDDIFRKGNLFTKLKNQINTYQGTLKSLGPVSSILSSPVSTSFSQSYIENHALVL